MIPTLIYPDDIGKLTAALHDVDLLLLGEIHGVAENVHIIELIVNTHVISDVRPLVLAFEWMLTTIELNELNAYIHREVNNLPDAPFFHDSDGRFTQTHVEFFKKIRNSSIGQNVAIEIFDTADFDDYESSMANNLLTVCEKHRHGLVIAETGVMHARKSPHGGGNGIKPMAAYLHDVLVLHTASIFIRYNSGEVEVDGEVYNITHAASQIEGPGDAFDYELCVPRAHPA